MSDKLILTEENIVTSIYKIRGEKVMLDVDLAMLYGVETKVLNQAVTRNIDRFPVDFMFTLSREEYNSLRSQIVTLKNTESMRGKHSKYPPRAFTEQGVAMLSSVLSSERAITINIAIMRTFVKMRQIMLSNIEMSKRLDDLERIIFDRLDENSADIEAIRNALMQLTKEDEPEPRRPIGYK
jgi:ORF6N domain